MIGADGGRSTVRKQCDIAFDGFTWPERFIVLTTPYDFEAGRGYCYRSYFADPGAWCNCFKVSADGPPGLWRTVFPTDSTTPEAELTSDDAVQACCRNSFPASKPYEIVHRNLYVTHQRVAATFRKGRVLLAGDAAHINNPIGGMGLNGGIQDGVNLADKLARIMLDGAPDTLLDLYDLQRRTVAAEFVQEQSIENKKRLEARDPEVRKRNLDELRAIAADPARARQFLLRTSMIASQRRAAAMAARRGMTMLAPITEKKPTMRPFLSASRRFAEGADTPRAFLERCLDELAACEPEVGAFVVLDLADARAAADRARPRVGARASRCRRSTACRSASRTSSKPSTCRPRWARRCSRAGARKRMRLAYRRCGKRAASSSAKQ